MSSESTAKPTSSENIVAQKYDRCCFSVGVIASVILFRRRGWPIALSTGFGAGAAYADCDRSFNPARIPGTRVVSAQELAALAAQAQQPK
ncbi:DUF543-domain-containing protein [Rhodofomes roseus]|uniref:MICOS complex subunit MIC10 n=1 Tax=Rhodofomes roseus TaxID=34475 RepID=A0ABQ8KBI2_9APHY|nr:DUF543-domain-containing protein [Rhodofomes roseus]KAH9834814.1 DUF543-domain-containing protein [Rhodofomes roseus]